MRNRGVEDEFDAEEHGDLAKRGHHDPSVLNPGINVKIGADSRDSVRNVAPGLSPVAGAGLEKQGFAASRGGLTVKDASEHHLVPATRGETCLERSPTLSLKAV